MTTRALVPSKAASPKKRQLKKYMQPHPAIPNLDNNPDPRLSRMNQPLHTKNLLSRSPSKPDGFFDFRLFGITSEVRLYMISQKETCRISKC